jgi:uncharacterized peroxidase-related enzyme
MLDAVTKSLGMTPNLHATLANAPAALRFYLNQVQALSGGVLSPALREQIALATAGANQCDYCASAHSLLGAAAGLENGELASNLRGYSADPKTESALAFARAIVRSRGRIEDSHLGAVRDAGFTEEEIVEIIAHVGMNLFTNYFNHIAGTEVDFPFVSTAEPQAA